MGKVEIFTGAGVEVLEAPAESIWALKLAIHYARNAKRPKTVLVGLSTAEHVLKDGSFASGGRQEFALSHIVKSLYDA